jgi:hypothetical protein
MNQTLCGSIRSRAAGAQPLQRVLVGLVVARAVDRPTADERSAALTASSVSCPSRRLGMGRPRAHPISSERSEVTISHHIMLPDTQGLVLRHAGA